MPENATGLKGMKEARLYSKLDGGKVECHLCSFRCKIAEGRLGVCGVRQNIGGALYTKVYGSVIARNVDPIEKKPLFHFLPGSRSYSIATAGCNFRCLHCQNFEISQMPRNEKRVLGESAGVTEIVEDAATSGCKSISYTYTEPTIFFEYAYDIGRLALGRGLKNVFVTNGYMTKECLDELKGTLSAANVDIKGFTEDFYKKVCGATLKPVLESIEQMKAMGVWVEVTTLVIPTLNDSDEELRGIARWIKNVDPSMPWHVSAFYPTYKLTDIERTPLSTVKRAYEIGRGEGLKYVYTGNVPGTDTESTVCYNCNRMLVQRRGFTVLSNVISNGNCPYCSTSIEGVWE